MIDLIQQRQDCPCADCRAQRCESPIRYDRQISSRTRPQRAYPVRRARAARPTCATTSASYQNARPTGASSLTVSEAIATLGLPGYVPLNVYPIESNSTVQSAMQFWFEVFTTSIHPHVEVPEGWNPKAFWGEKLAWAAADPMWFHSTVAFAESMKQRAICGSSKKSSEIIKHSAKAISGLINRIGSDESHMDDLAILTIVSLMSADFVGREVKAWKSHIEGLERILAVRSGLDSLNNEYIKHKVNGFQLFWLYKQMSLGTAPEFATYPDHPFPPDLCLAISSFPQELAEVSLEGCLDTSLIRMMAPIFKLSAKFKGGGEKEREDLRRSKCLAYQLEELFSITDLTQLEMLLIAALVDYSITLDAERRQHWLLVGSCQINCGRILFTGLEYEPSRHNLLVWIGALFVACGEHTLQTALLGRKLLSRCRREEHFDRSDLLAICRSIIWDEVLTNRLDAAYDFGAVTPHGSESLTASPEYALASSTISSEPGHNT